MQNGGLSSLANKTAMAFRGATVPIGKKIVQSANPIRNGLAYKLKSQLFKGKGPIGGSGNFRMRMK